MLNIYIDSRETTLYGLLIERDLDIYADRIIITHKQLDVGDILIEIHETKMLFERKTVSDMISSIKDGRFREQKTRILASDSIPTYIVEGGSIVTTDELLIGSYLNTIYRDNIPVLFMKNITETVTLILMISTRLINDEKRFEKKAIENYLECLKIKSKRIENIDPKICFELQLCQIPNISVKIAQSISRKHKNLCSLINILKDMNEEKKIEYLTGFDNVGKKKAQIIVEYLF